MPKKKPKKYGTSDATLSRLWRLVVKKQFCNRCIICHNPNVNELECHHIVHVRCKILRWDWRNGVPVCSPRLTGRSCHAYCDTLNGREFVRLHIKPEDWEFIKSHEHIIHKDFLRENNLSETDWRLQVKAELEGIINEF